MTHEKYKKEKIVHWDIQNVDSWGHGGKWRQLKGLTVVVVVSARPSATDLKKDFGKSWHVTGKE